MENLLNLFFRLIFLLSSLVLHANNNNFLSPPTIEFTPGGGRLGDQLLHYVKAKWISYKNDIPLLVPKSTFFADLKLSEEEYLLIKKQETTSKRKKTKLECEKSHESLKDHLLVPINKKDITLNRTNKTCYHISFFPFLNYDDVLNLKADTSFVKELRRLISPKEPLTLIQPPKDRISIALHIRKEHGHGSGKTLKSIQIFDIKDIDTKPFSSTKKTHMDLCFPDKFPPEQFFIDQIKYLSEYFDHEPLYVFVFTDDAHPKSLASRIKEKVNLSNITYDYRTEDSPPPKTVLEDFFSMMHFDCLIRSQASNFSLVAELLGNNKIIIAPKNYHWEVEKSGNRHFLVIDAITFQENL